VFFHGYVFKIGYKNQKIVTQKIPKSNHEIGIWNLYLYFKMTAKNKKQSFCPKN